MTEIAMERKEEEKKPECRDVEGGENSHTCFLS